MVNMDVTDFGFSTPESCGFYHMQNMLLGFALGCAATIYVSEFRGWKFFQDEDVVITRVESSESESGDSSDITPGEGDDAPVITPYDQEIFEMLQDEVTQREQTQLRKELEKPPIDFVRPAFGSRYASIEDMGQRNREHRDKVESIVLTRQKEIEILDGFRDLEGKNLIEVMRVLKINGYTVHPIYVNSLPKQPREEYSNKVVGVKIKGNAIDTSKLIYDNIVFTRDEDMAEFAKRTIVTDLIDVGGQDRYNRGRALV